MPPDRRYHSHAFENMIEHIFLADILREMWRRDHVLEVAKADVDSWGYDVVLALAGMTRYVQLKTSVPADVNLRLFQKPGACVIGAIPSEVDGELSIRYRFWEAPEDHAAAARDLPVAKSAVYRRGRQERDEREGHRTVKATLFSKPVTIQELAACLFPTHVGDSQRQHP